MCAKLECALYQGDVILYSILAILNAKKRRMIEVQCRLFVKAMRNRFMPMNLSIDRLFH